MAHLKKVDGDQNTVIMVQVENEIGLLGSDRVSEALAAFLTVTKELTISRSGTIRPRCK